jgi:hypothetical protein
MSDQAAQSSVITHGANGPGASMSVTRAAQLIVIASTVTLVALGIIFRRPIGD